MGMHRRTGSPGSEGSTSTAMHPLPGQHMPVPSLYGAAADWTPKKGGMAAGLADSSASPVSVIPKNTCRRPNLTQDAPSADRHGSTQSGSRRANGSHIGSRMMGSLYGSTPQHSAAGVLYCSAVFSSRHCVISHLAMCAHQHAHAWLDALACISCKRQHTLGMARCIAGPESGGFGGLR